jgi:hypothetical protein
MIKKLLAVALIALFSSTVLADECTQTCDSEYQECKNIAESPTAKQACEDDLKQCKADCQ